MLFEAVSIGVEWYSDIVAAVVGTVVVVVGVAVF